MRVLNSQGSPADTAKKMAQMMFNIENGVQVHNTEEDTKNFMKISVPSKIDDAPAIEYQYKPATGVVFYIPGDQFDLDQLMEAVCSEITKLGYQHLTQYRVVDATPCAVIYSKSRFREQTCITNYDPTMDCISSKFDAYSHLPARQLVKQDDNPHSRLPPIISTTAGFTWYFLNLAVLLLMLLFYLP